MAPSLLCYILLQMFLLSNAHYYLTVHPVDPVVSIGASIQLNCSINCPLGVVEWKGLDNENKEQYIAPGYSVQTLENISISMGGTKYCEATCPAYRRSYRQSVELHVYALPKMLLLSNRMINGVHYLKCSMELVYPPPEISCYRESEMLGEATDLNEVPDGDLYNVTWSWVIPVEDWLSEISYRCEAQVLVNDQVLTREGTLKISSKEETTTTVPASPTSQITTALPWKQEVTTIGSQQSTIPGKYTRNPNINSVTTHSTPPATGKGPTKPINIAETTTAVPASPNIQITSTLLQKQETPYLTNTIITPQTMQKDATIESQQSTLPGKYTKNATINTVTTQSTLPSTAQSPTEPINIDGFNLMWTVVPATCLFGSFLLSLQIYRQLTKKGFFQPNHTEMTTVKKDAKSQRSLQTVFCYEVRTKKEFSMC